MVDLKDKSEEINNYLKTMRQALEDQLEETQLSLSDVQERYRIALQGNDLSENAAYDTAKKELNEHKMTIVTLNTQLAYLRAIDDRRPYIPINVIIPYSTFRLRNIRTNKEYVYMLIPVDIMDEDSIGLLSISTRIGKAVNKCVVGDQIEAIHDITGVLHTYKVEEIY